LDEKARLQGPFPAGAKEALVLDAGPEWQLTVTGQVRPRFVMHSGLDLAGTASEWREYVTQRARLGFSAEAPSGVALTLEVQDVRTWGEETDTADFSANGLDLHRAFATVPITDELELDVGRLELALDDERLVGRDDFTQRGRAFDGGHLVWTSIGGRYSVDALYAKISEPAQTSDGNVPPGVSGDVDLVGVHASLELAPDHVLAPLYLVQIRQAPTDVRHTAGLHVKGKNAGFSYRAEGYYQYGKLLSETIGAYLAALTLGYELEHPMRPGLKLWGEILSGDGAAENTFDTLYAANHGYYGEMDLFGAPASDPARRGFIDLGARIEADPLPELHAKVDGHWFRTVKKAPGGEANLGFEIDLGVSWAAMDYVTLDAFGGLFVPESGMYGLLGAPGSGKLYPDYMTFLTTNVQF
jgi:hypothetical protein